MSELEGVVSKQKDMWKESKIKLHDSRDIWSVCMQLMMLFGKIIKKIKQNHIFDHSSGNVLEFWPKNFITMTLFKSIERPETLHAANNILLHQAHTLEGKMALASIN